MANILVEKQISSAAKSHRGPSKFVASDVSLSTDFGIKIWKLTIPCLLIASKFEEYYPEPVERMLRHFMDYMHDPLKFDVVGFNKRFSTPEIYKVSMEKSDILNLEGEILRQTGFILCKPPVLDFISLFSTLTDVHPSALRTAVKYSMIIPFINNIWST